MSSAQLLSLLERHYPTTWEYANYDSEICVFFDIDQGDNEYMTVTQPFLESRCRVIKVQRIQHPYRYGQYILRKEQLQKRLGYIPAERTVYHGVSQVHVKVAAETSCDVRRYQSGKTPTFYDSAESSVLFLNYHEPAVIVLKQLINSQHDVWPMYVVYIKT